MDRRAFLQTSASAALAAVPQIPAKRVVLTFDDAVKSHRTFVAPLLKELGFKATFFVTHSWMNDMEHFMSWRDISEIHQMGFEIGNHSWTHADFSVPKNAARLAGELALIENELKKVDVPKPFSFAYSGNSFGPEAVKVLRENGYRLARRGGSPEVPYGTLDIGPLFDPGRHDPLLIPTTADAYPAWTFDHFVRVMSHSREGQVIVLQFHGVPDVKHPWVHTPPDQFKRYMSWLKDNGFQALALRDLEPYLNPSKPVADAMAKTRYRTPKDGRLVLPAEVAASQADPRYWLENMLQAHGYSTAEAAQVLGWSNDRVATASRELQPVPRQGLKVLPYPGGRALRIGFREGAIDPLRGTKASVFLPWDPDQYVVVDLPEAIFSNIGLLFLAHTHIPTVWNDQNKIIDNVDWQRVPDGGLRSRWRLPNGLTFGASVSPDGREAQMDLWLTNGTEHPLSKLRTQICVLLKGANDFNPQTNDNKIMGKTAAAVKSRKGSRWMVTEWERCGRTWGNALCPCLHSDPVLPDCAPGETVRVTGRLWFAEGTQPPISSVREP